MAQGLLTVTTVEQGSDAMTVMRTRKEDVRTKKHSCDLIRQPDSL
jgi:hypothetical protein